MKLRDFLAGGNVQTGIIIATEIYKDPEHGCFPCYISDPLFNGWSTDTPEELLGLEVSYVGVDYDEKSMLIEVKPS